MDNIKIESPINYTGNKQRILNQILPIFPKNINNFFDVCCGGCSISLNVDARNVYCIDNNKYIINILKTLQFYNYSTIIKKIEKIIKEYDLSYTIKYGCDYYKQYIKDNNGLKYYNKEQFIKLRDFFNKNKFNNYKEQSIYLYVLISYCFNNDLRFNSKNEFNMPIGKTDFNKHKLYKLKSFKDGIKSKNIFFLNKNFNIIKNLKFNDNDFVYIDPPYLISNAVYNENNNWNESKEKELLKILDILNKKGIKFALSNILEKKDKENILLKQWIKDNNFKIIDIKYNYISSSYNKINRYANEKEVLIINYDL